MAKKIDVNDILKKDVMKMMKTQERVMPSTFMETTKPAEIEKSLFTPKQLEKLIEVARKHTEYRKTHPFVRNADK